jgi:hypothetical protein
LSLSNQPCAMLGQRCSFGVLCSCMDRGGQQVWDCRPTIP